MKLAEDLIKEYLDNGKVIQVATSANGAPWICSVYFVVDRDLKIYWLSYPGRRHSLEIKENPKTAIALAVNANAPVVGIQAEGLTAEVTDAVTVGKIMLRYVAKYGVGKHFHVNFLQKKNKHKMYCFTPDRFMLFDEENFKGEHAQETVCSDGRLKQSNF